MPRVSRLICLFVASATAAFLAVAGPAAAHHDTKHTNNTAAFCFRKLENGKEHHKCSALPCPDGEFRGVDGQCKPCDPVLGCPTQQMSVAQATTNEQFATIAATGWAGADAGASFTSLSLRSDPLPLSQAYYEATFFRTYPQAVVTIDGATREYGCYHDPVSAKLICTENGRPIARI